MKISTMSIICEGYIQCQSCFYSAHDVLQGDRIYYFSEGINKMYGEIDSGVWSISYLLSMYNCRKGDFVLFKQPEVIVNNDSITLQKFGQYCCYMDKQYPLFSTNVPISKLIQKGMRRNKLNDSLDELRECFGIDKERFERPLSCVGNEIFRAMAAIGYAYGKQVYCFPWFSQMRFQNYNANIEKVLDLLAERGNIVIVPIGK